MLVLQFTARNSDKKIPLKKNTTSVRLIILDLQNHHEDFHKSRKLISPLNNLWDMRIINKEKKVLLQFFKMSPKPRLKVLFK
jgi:hypothetical protein